MLACATPFLAKGWRMAGNIKALFFDVFGTLVDWRSGVARECERILAPLDR
jgi:hypothetical protein